ncbi:MAG TPA: YggS family pyridoxal phosphate-dependent enzyme [Candidatus Limnocylindrales bacterium]
MTPGAPPDDRAVLRAARDAVLARIAGACGRVARDPIGVTLVAVTKTVPAERIRAAVDAGLTTLGENRVQEAQAKATVVDGAVWHLVGPLQSNKARRALETFSTIQTVDSVELAARLDRLVAEGGTAEAAGGRGDGGGRYPVLLQVNVDRDPAKAGFLPEALEAALDDVLTTDHLAVRGLMTVGRLVGDSAEARPTFAALRELSERLRSRRPELGPELSMGMTDDYEVAVEEGATIVRVGRAIFGERPPAHDHPAPTDGP